MTSLIFQTVFAGHIGFYSTNYNWLVTTKKSDDKQNSLTSMGFSDRKMTHIELSMVSRVAAFTSSFCKASRT